MKHLIIDGHNAINLIPELARYRNRPDDERRKALINFLSGWKAVRLFPGIITVVFDSRHADYATVTAVQGIKCVFATSGQDADEKIKSMIRAMADATDVTVVTHDNNVANSCRAHGAIVEKPQTYFSLPSKKGSAGKKEAYSDDKKIGSQA